MIAEVDQSRRVPGADHTVRLSAAVGAAVTRAKRKYFQDVRRWLALGLLDAVYPMNYEKDIRAFARRIETFIRRVRYADRFSAEPAGIPVVTGVMFDKRSSATVRAQIEQSRRHTSHFAAFAYNSLFERLDERGRRIMDTQSRSRASLRRRLISYIRQAARSARKTRPGKHSQLADG
jgi:uncharacterized lipoprotein YddW (UPF0748 family)